MMHKLPEIAKSWLYRAPNFPERDRPPMHPALMLLIGAFSVMLVMLVIATLYAALNAPS